MKYRIKRIYNHITRKYAVRIGNPSAVRYEPFRDEMGRVLNPIDYLDPEHRPFTNQRFAEYTADDINQHFPGAGAYVEEIRRYSYSLSLETLWRRGDAAVI